METNLEKLNKMQDIELFKLMQELEEQQEEEGEEEDEFMTYIMENYYVDSEDGADIVFFFEASDRTQVIDYLASKIS